MIQSQIFYTNAYKVIEEEITSLLKREITPLTSIAVDSPRSVGDTIEGILGKNCGAILGEMAKEYSSDFPRRAMEDLAFTDQDGFYYAIDVKTHRIDSDFNMPNLTSVHRLSQFYEDDKNYFVVLKVNYYVQEEKIMIENVTMAPIEFLSWDCLTIGALGWGQIQIANSNIVTIIPHNKRKKWMIEMSNYLMEFYPQEISKINERIEYFTEVKQYWQNKTQ